MEHVIPDVQSCEKKIHAYALYIHMTFFYGTLISTSLVQSSPISNLFIQYLYLNDIVIVKLVFIIKYPIIQLSPCSYFYELFMVHYVYYLEGPEALSRLDLRRSVARSSGK